MVVTDIIFQKIKSLFNKNSFTATIINSTVDKTASVRKNARVYDSKIGRYTYVTRNCLIQNTEIGAFCSISENCQIGMPSHPTDFVSTSPVFLEGSNFLKKNFDTASYNDCLKTFIGNDVWIGCFVKIKAGIKIGNGAIIGAGAVVTKDIPAYAVYAGVPAKQIGKRFSEDVISRIESIKWWNWSEERLLKNKGLWNSPEEFAEKNEEQGNK